ncbi:MAG TPA: peptidoglycan-binding protein [Propionicimonas sp.]
MKISSRVLSAVMGVAMVCGLALVGVAPANAVTTSAKASFISGVVTPAQKAQRQFGVPASVSIAQAIVASDWGTSAPAKQAKNYFDTPCSASMTASQFAKLAEAQVGKPYVLGAETLVSQADPPKFDCSELVQWLFGRSGNPITDLAAAQYNVTRKVASGASPKTGDLVFLRNNPARSNGIGHVAIVTKKLSSGDWEVIEARGRAYGVVRTTLSYWKQRSYYAGMRRYAKLVFANSDGVEASAAALYQTGCVTISSTRFAKFGSVTDSFAGHAAAVVNDSAYKAARNLVNNIPAYVDAIAKVEQPKDAAAYARTIKGLISSYHLTDYDVVPFDLVLLSGDKGTKVSAMQYLLRATGSSVKATGTFDSATVSAVKKFQAAKKLTKDGQAGPNTLAAMFGTVSSGASGDRVAALNALLAAIGQTTTPGATFGKETQASLKLLQAWAGRSATGVADSNTWAVLFMTPDKAPAPVLSGTPQVTQTLTASVGKWSPGSFALAYQWYRGSAPIAGAIGTSYTLKPEDAGTGITVAVTGTRPGYTTIARTATPTGAIAKAKLGATPTPKITGKATVGEALTAVPGTWSPGPVPLAYQWHRGTTAIPGANAASYTVQAADQGAKLTVVVTSAKPGYETVSRTSGATAAVAKGTLSATPTPTVTGTTTVGRTLTADAGSWAPAPVALSYQWFRGKSAIKGATGTTYVLQDADAKATIRVAVTGAKAGFTTVTKTSGATEAVVPANQVTTGKPKITGTATSGKTLRVKPGTWGPGKVKLSYRWYRGSKAIGGATKSTYKLKSADKGKTITVKVTGSRSGFASATAKASVKVRK